MKRKNYETPTMKVVQLQHQCHILAGSQVESVDVQNYNWQTEEEE